MVHIYLKQTSTDISPLQCMIHKTVTSEQIELPATTLRLTSGRMTSPVYSSADNSTSFRRSLNLGQVSSTYNTHQAKLLRYVFLRGKKVHARGACILPEEYTCNKKEPSLELFGPSSSYLLASVPSDGTAMPNNQLLLDKKLFISVFA